MFSGSLALSVVIISSVYWSFIFQGVVVFNLILVSTFVHLSVSGAHFSWKISWTLDNQRLVPGILIRALLIGLIRLLIALDYVMNPLLNNSIWGFASNVGRLCVYACGPWVVGLPLIGKIWLNTPWEGEQYVSYFFSKIDTVLLADYGWATTFNVMICGGRFRAFFST